MAPKCANCGEAMIMCECDGEPHPICGCGTHGW